MKNQVKKSHANQAYQLYYHGMMLPGFIFLILFNFVPMFGAIMAFQDYRPAKGFFGSDFVGLKHFKYLFEMPDSFELFRNTLIIALGKIVLTTITSIDSTLYEAASIDGATWWKKVWHVTLPGIRTTIVLMAVMNLGNILNAGFDQVYNLYSASVYATGDILDTYVYRVGLQGLQYSFGTAVGLLKSVIAFVLMIGANKLAQKYTDSKIF